MRGFVFLLLVGLMAHAVFVQPGPVESPIVAQRGEIVIVQGADVNNARDSWGVQEVAIAYGGDAEAIPEESADTSHNAVESPSNDPAQPEEEMSGADADTHEIGGDDGVVDGLQEVDEVPVADEGIDLEEDSIEPVVEEVSEVVEEVYEPTPVIDQPVLVIEEDSEAPVAEESASEINLVEVLRGE